MKLVIIEWNDASSFDAWADMEAAIRKNVPTLCRTVGWVVAESKEAITVVATTADDKVTGDMTIIKSSIVKTTVLKRK